MNEHEVRILEQHRLHEAREALKDADCFLHSSRARGRIPTVLKAAAEVRYLGQYNSDYRPLIVLRASEPSSYNRIWGVTPGEEGEDEFAEAVEAFS